ncbi:MAG: M20/M25/M40 family metallo-hydrolase [Acidobacteria bacterium]|nr:M20/M25/M40 family metallo-hydrolase [Acidobacteriota bacterium]
MTRTRCLLLLAALLSLAILQAPLAQQHSGTPNPAQAWWEHIKFLADDKLEGRDTGSAGHRQAAEYIANAFKRAGLKPAGTKGYLQPVQFVSRRVQEEQCSLALVRNGQAEPIVLGDEATLSMRIAHAPRVEAPLVFVGYGLAIPEARHDDFAGMDLKGKVVVLLSGGPPQISGPLKAHYQSNRGEALKRAGVIGVLSIQNPRGQDIPWDRSKLARFRPTMALADSSVSGGSDQQLAVTINPARAEKLFAGSGHTFAEILALADKGEPLPRFALPALVRAQVKYESKQLESQNVVGLLPGTDPKLKNEYVVLSAHLDHIGVGQPINGDSIYNGAMDNASGIATLLETALALQKEKARLKRAVVFVAVTAEENGLLGSKYFATRPTVPVAAMVANVNIDMFLPLFPLRSLIVQGLEESNLADDLQAVGKELGLQILSDPEPERNAFTRSDQYSFIQRGVPAASLKVGFAKGSPEHEIVKRWRTERYHAPADDLQQPVDFQAAADFNRAYLLMVKTVANRSERPRWNADSFFRRFAQ